MCSIPSELRTHLKSCQSNSWDPGFIGNDIAQDQKNDKREAEGE